MEIRFRIDDFTVELYAIDRKGKRTRWGDRILKLYSEGREVGQAVFGQEEKDIPEPYFAEGKIFYFAHSDQFHDVIDLLRNEKAVYIVWKPVSDPKEIPDGDAFFLTER